MMTMTRRRYLIRLPKKRERLRSELGALLNPTSALDPTVRAIRDPMKKIAKANTAGMA